MEQNFKEIAILINQLQDKLNEQLTKATDNDWNVYKNELSEVELLSIKLQYYKKIFKKF